MKEDAKSPAPHQDSNPVHLDPWSDAQPLELPPLTIGVYVFQPVYSNFSFRAPGGIVKLKNDGKSRIRSA